MGSRDIPGVLNKQPARPSPSPERAPGPFFPTLGVAKVRLPTTYSRPRVVLTGTQTLSAQH